MKQLSFKKTAGWGGRRRGAGRKNLSRTVNHMARPRVDHKKPLHITMRLRDRLPNLRTHRLLKAFKTSARGATPYGLRVVHFSLLSNHLHLIVEADNNQALGDGMRSLGGRFGRIIRKEAATDRTQNGAVFAGRYHLHVLKTPREMKHALEYVLLNRAKHDKYLEHLDRFSSASRFPDWKLLLGRRFTALIRSQIEDRAEEMNELRGEKSRKIQRFPDREVKANTAASDYICPPQSWLCRVGWQRAV